MLRAKPTYLCALGAMFVAPAAACVSPDAPSMVDTAPLVGRFQTRDGVTDLTVRSFADGANAVPTNSYARVVADIAPNVRQDSDSDDPRAKSDTDFAGASTIKRGF
jgi:hypothetical protein